MRKIRFIGLGIMGKPMSKNLLNAGYELQVWDINQEAVAELAAAGAQTGSNSKAVAASNDIVITMLPNSPQVKEVVCGKDGILAGAKPGMILKYR
jgi:2-hydroxy-3-oxopropionate reductase